MLRPHCHCGCPVKVGSFGGILRSPYDRDYLLVIIGLLSQIVYKLNLNNYCDQSDRSIPLKLPTFTGRPKWQGGRSILNAKTNSFFVFLTLLLKTKNERGIRSLFFVRKFENEKRKRNSFFVRKIWKRKTKKEFVFRSQIWKRKRKRRYIHGPRSIIFDSVIVICVSMCAK